MQTAHTAPAPAAQALPGKPQDPAYPYATFQVGGRANVRGHTDVRPATVVAVERGGTKVTVRYDRYQLAAGQKPAMVAGGFSAHCTNQHELAYDIEEDPNGGTEVFTLRRWRGRYVWTPAGGTPSGRQQLGAGWSAFYDYNF